jgi:hypothetical protein
MAQRRHSVREAAASIMSECGPYARMAALFLAREAEDAGDAGGQILWTRVAHAIVDMQGRPDPSPGPCTLH